ncbi:hypothetical protein RI129_006021 [Pyrocoelia pectoralis]|uniref:Uncharacterized protein n=1 Tax=Pyrocoelia pectoralis TaxID=417401 RepID=A0AAN7ZP46_9COLE
MITQNSQICKLDASNEHSKILSNRQFNGDHTRPSQVQGKIIESFIEKIHKNPIHSRRVSHDGEHDFTKRTSRLSKIVDRTLCNDTVINMNETCSVCPYPKAQKVNDTDTDYEIFSIKSKGHSKFFPQKLTNSKLVQTSNTKLKHKKESKSKKIEELKRQLKAVVNQKEKGKKEIYIITGSNTPLKLDSQLTEEAKPLGNKLVADRENCEKKIHTDGTIANDAHNAEGEDNAGKTHDDSEIQKTKHQDGKKCQEEVGISAKLTSGKNGNRDGNSIGLSCVSTASQTCKRKVSLTSSDYINLSEPRKKEKDFPKFVSTKLKFKEHRSKRSDSTICEKYKNLDDGVRKRKRGKCERNNENLESVARVTGSKNTHHRSNVRNEVYEKRNVILDDIEKAYLKHKHILPKEAVEALKRNIQKWKNMNAEVDNKSSEQQTNILDLEEALKKNVRCNEGVLKHNVDKCGMVQENISSTGLKKKVGKQNDLILLNAIVTGISNINCANDTMHINKIPKFVRLERMIQDQQNDSSSKGVGEVNLPQHRKEHVHDQFSILPFSNHLLCGRPDQDLRQEVSFSHLNVKPVVKVRSSLESQLNSLSALFPSFNKSALNGGPSPENVSPFNKLKYLRPKHISFDNQLVSLPNQDISFNVDGVEPPMKRKSQVPAAYVPRKGIVTHLRKLEVIKLPILEVQSSVSDCAKVPHSISHRLSRSSRTQTRKKESHRVRKSSKSSESSSESPLQLMQILDGHLNKSVIPENRNDDNLRNLYISDQDAIAALKYLPPQRKEMQNTVTKQKIRRKKLHKSIASIVEIKPTQLISEENRYRDSDLSIVPSKETELSFKSLQDEDQLRANQPFAAQMRCKRSKPLTTSAYYMVHDRISNDSVSSNSKLRKCKKATVEMVRNSRDKGVRSRMINYTRNIEETKRNRSRESAETSRDNSKERENSCFSDLMGRRPSSASGVSTSSGVSLNSESDKQLERDSSVGTADTAALNDNITPPIEIISTALTKITEETVSQDTIDTSEQSTFSRNIIDGKLRKRDLPKVFSNQSSKGKDQERCALVEKISTPSTSQSNHHRTILDDTETKKHVMPKKEQQNLKIDTIGISQDVMESKKRSSTTTVKNLKDDEIRQLTESVKNSIISEIQALNMANMSNLMQLILKTKCEDNKSASNVKQNQNTNSGENNVAQQKNAHIRWKNSKPACSVVSDRISSDSIRSKSDVKNISPRKPLGKKTQSNVGNPFNAQQVVDAHNFNATPESHLKMAKKKTSATSLDFKRNVSTDSFKCKLSGSKIPKSVNNKYTMGRSGSAVRSPEIQKNENKTNRFYVKSTTSDTKTSVTSAKWSSYRDTQCSSVKLTKENKAMSKFEKRKLYGAALRQKSAKQTSDDDCMKSAAACSRAQPADGDNLSGSIGNTNNRKSLHDGESGKATPKEQAQLQQDGLQQAESKRDVTNNDSNLTYDLQESKLFNLKEPSKQMQLQEAEASNKEENIYQTFTALTSHPNVTEVFKHKFDKSATKTFETSFPVYVDKQESVHYPLKKVESLFRYTKREKADESYSNCKDTANSCFDGAELLLTKLSRAKVNLLDVDYGPALFKNDFTATIRGGHTIKNNIEPSTKNIRRNRKRNEEERDFERNDPTFQLPMKLSSPSTKKERERQGNYLIFKIDHNMQKREHSSSPESFKIFMNNHTTLDNEFGKDSGKPFLVNAAPLSESIESGYTSVNSRDGAIDIQDKPSCFPPLSSLSNSEGFQYNKCMSNEFINVRPYFYDVDNYPEKDTLTNYEKSIQTDFKRRESLKRKQKKFLRYIQSSYSLRDFILSDSSFQESVAEAVEQRLSEDILRPLIEESFHTFLRTSLHTTKSDKGLQTNVEENLKEVDKEAKSFNQVYNSLGAINLPRKTYSDPTLPNKELSLTFSKHSSLTDIRSEAKSCNLYSSEMTLEANKSQSNLKIHMDQFPSGNTKKAESEPILLGKSKLQLKVILKINKYGDGQGNVPSYNNSKDSVKQGENFEEEIGEITECEVNKQDGTERGKQSCSQLETISESPLEMIHRCPILLTSAQIFDKLLEIYEGQEQLTKELFKNENFVQSQVELVKGQGSSRSEVLVTYTKNKPSLLDNLKTRVSRVFKFRGKHAKIDAKSSKIASSIELEEVSTPRCCIKDEKEFTRPIKGNLPQPLPFFGHSANDYIDQDFENHLPTIIANANTSTQMNSVQEILLNLLKSKDMLKNTQYFLPLVEAVANNRINSVIKLYGLLKMLKNVENLSDNEPEKFDNLYAHRDGEQLQQNFARVRGIAEVEAKLNGEILSDKAIMLLHILVTKFIVGGEFYSILSKYIGRGLISNEIELEATMVYFVKYATSQLF